MHIAPRTSWNAAQIFQSGVFKVLMLKQTKHLWSILIGQQWSRDCEIYMWIASIRRKILVRIFSILILIGFHPWFKMDIKRTVWSNLMPTMIWSSSGMLLTYRWWKKPRFVLLRRLFFSLAKQLVSLAHMPVRDYSSLKIPFQQSPLVTGCNICHGETNSYGQTLVSVFHIYSENS